MSGTRQDTNPNTSNFIQPLHHCIAFVEEYKHHRENSPSTLHGIAASFLKLFGYEFKKLNQERQYECNNVIKKLCAAETYEQKSKIIDLLSQLAKNAQQTKEGYKKYPEKVVALFVKDSSLWAKTLHAVRTLWVAHLRKDYSTEFIAEINTLRERISSYKAYIDNQLDQNLQISKNEETAKNQIFNCLLDRQDPDALKKARKNFLFPLSLPIPETLRGTEKITIYKEYPAIYNPNYHNIFFVHIIKADPAREVEYIKCLKSQFSKYSVTDDEMDILNARFFEAYIRGEEMIEETAYVTPPSTPQNEEENSVLTEQSKNYAALGEVAHHIASHNTQTGTGSLGLFSPSGEEHLTKEDNSTENETCTPPMYFSRNERF